MRRCAKPFFQAVCADKRRRTVHSVEIPDLCRNVKICGGIIQLLFRQFPAEDSRKLIFRNRLQGARIQDRRRFLLHIRTDIVPLLRHLLLFKINFVRYFLFHLLFPFWSSYIHFGFPQFTLPQYCNDVIPAILLLSHNSFVFFRRQNLS